MAGRRRMKTGQAILERAEMLERTQLSHEFSWKELEELAKYVSTEPYSKGSMIFREGDRKSFMCIVVKGSVDILKESTQQERKLIATLGPGKIFGEMSVIDGSPRSADAEASTETILMVLSKEEFDRLLNDKPSLGAKMLKKIAISMSYRLRETTGILVDYLGRGNKSD
jgi:CRP/FNR family transcriptional regulator, cyclic AMP receptor protein